MAYVLLTKVRDIVDTLGSSLSVVIESLGNMFCLNRSNQAQVLSDLFRHDPRRMVYNREIYNEKTT